MRWLFVIAGNWADRFDGPLDDIFDLQDQITASVVGAIAPKRNKPKWRVRSQRRRRRSVRAWRRRAVYWEEWPI
jgi:hypothetical protein